MSSNQINYFYGKLSQAVEELTIHPGNIKQRLLVAGNIFMTVSPDVFPESLQLKILGIRKELTKREPKYKESRLEATIKRNHMPTNVKVAKRINSLYHEIGEYIKEDL